jgi:hypothetical protein
MISSDSAGNLFLVDDANAARTLVISAGDPTRDAQISAFFAASIAPRSATSNTAAVAEQIAQTWDGLVFNWSAQPTLVATLTGGQVWAYTLAGTTRYRMIPTPYVAAQDAFYSAFDGATLSNPIIARG